ncbi:MAG: SMI1/KNR4 family protein [Acidimicrobiales bacterium]
MDSDQLRDLLESHSEVLAQSESLDALGIDIDVDAPEVAPPATHEQVDAVESALGVVLPESFRSALTTLSAAVSWSWWASGPFPEPFDDIFSGNLHWSIDTLVARDEQRRQWIETVFPDPDSYWDASWRDKVAFQAVGNGDLLAIDLDPARSGAVVYLSHELGEGHGYVLADSLVDLVDRWVPLGCPGAEDWQWLPFVPWDEGPIDPTCPAARRWVDMLGLRDDPPRTSPVVVSPEHVDALLEQFRRSPTTHEGRHAACRALKCCGTNRVSDILDLLRVDDSEIQPLAATRLADLGVVDAVPALAETARTGNHNGRILALGALHRIPGPEAEAAIRDIETERRTT